MCRNFKYGIKMEQDLNKVETTAGEEQGKGSRGKAGVKNVLEAFERIVEGAKGSNLEEGFFEREAGCIRYVSRKLKLSPMQAVLLALFVDRSEDRAIRMSEVASDAGCRTTRFLRLAADIDVLEERRYLRASRSRGSLSYWVPMEVLRALGRNEAYVHAVEPVTDVQSFFGRFSELMGEMEDDEITHEMLLLQTKEALEEIGGTYFARSLKGFGLHDEEVLLFVYMAHLFVENDDDNIGFHDMDNLYDNDKLPSWFKWRIGRGGSRLFTCRLIENVNEEGMRRSDCFKLTEFAKTDVLSELDLNLKVKAERLLIKSDSFPEKRLVYNPEEGRQVEELSAILSEERFREVQARLEGAGMRKGFCCLFYGSPGTGKTETVYQVARATGRDILRVDVDKIKSCWVGESEQNMKRFFERYRSVCKDSPRAPILLFNEADAVLGVRMEGAVRAVDKMENSIQNIILQEMEALEGIMIATTNLTTNLDKAFERRFLYKVQFNRPKAEARARIWRAMLPSLREEEAEGLAAQFDLSGGEIENVTRKWTVNAILAGKEAVEVAAIAEICRKERIAGAKRTSIGFRG